MIGRRAMLNAASPVIGIVVLFVIWEASVRLIGIPPYLLPAPSVIFAVIAANATVLMRHAAATASVILTAFFCAAGIGIPLALGISFSRPFRQLVYPIIVFSQLVPKIALAPMFVIWFGFGFLPKVLIAFLVSFFAIVIQSVVGFTSLRPEPLRVALSMGAGPLDLFLKVRLPHALPNIFAGLKLAIASASIGAIVGEFIASQQGLGYLVLIANGELNTPLAFAGMLLLSLMGVLLYFAVETVERLCTSWHIAQRSSIA